MIEQYKLSQIVEPCLPGEAPDWLDLGAPTEDELAEVAGRFGLPQWLLSAPLDPKERPRLDQEEGALLIVIRCSVQDGSPADPRFSTEPVGLVLTRDLLVTVCRRPKLAREHLSHFLSRKRHWSGIRLAFALFCASGAGYINNIERLEEMAGEAEASLRRSPENDILLGLLNIEKSLITTTVALKSNHALFEKFRQPEPFGLALAGDDMDILEDAITENQQAIFMAEIFSQVLSSMGEAFGSIISNNLNKIMKFLTGITIILMLPTIISGIYGMNIALPFADHPNAFSLMVIICLVLMGAVCLLFAWKKWF